jgi:hypothetical protein
MGREYWLFTMRGCRACRALKSTQAYDEAVEHLSELELVPYDRNEQIVKDKHVDRMPQMIVYHRGEDGDEEIKRLVGKTDIETELRNALPAPGIDGQ